MFEPACRDKTKSLGVYCLLELLSVFQQTLVSDFFLFVSLKAVYNYFVKKPKSRTGLPE